MDQDEIALRLKALADPARLRILHLLPATDTCEDVYNVGELATELAIPQPTVSHHLKVLLHAGLVKKRKMCRDCYYWIDKNTLDQISAALGSIAADPS